MKQVYLSLGSNLGDRIAHIRRALEMLAAAGIDIRRISHFYRTEPVDYLAQAWFVNCVSEACASLMPLQLLRRCQQVERKLGRRRGIPKGPRSIDIDILLYENAVVRCAELIVPHPRLAERRFVLVPLSELEPGLRHPLTQRTVLEMLRESQDQSQVVRLRAQDPVSTANATGQHA